MRWHQEPIRSAYDALYGPEGATLRTRFTREYESHFAALVSAAHGISSRLFVLYWPSRTGTTVPARETFCRRYFRDLSMRYNVAFLDGTDTLCAYDINAITLRPANDHPSRFAHQLIAHELSAHLQSIPRQCSITYNGTPPLCGDMQPGTKSVWYLGDTMPYTVTVNAQGFRMSHDIEIPKRRTRVLCLGDSFTFGVGLSNHDTYPELLAGMNSSLEVINAGILGYTIPDEAALFIERAQYVAPDITIVQVLDNDIYDCIWFMRNEFARKRMRYAPSRLEKDFIDRIIARHAKMK